MMFVPMMARHLEVKCRSAPEGCSLRPEPVSFPGNELLTLPDPLDSRLPALYLGARSPVRRGEARRPRGGLCAAYVHRWAAVGDHRTQDSQLNDRKTGGCV
jgi:hypothetical protein